MNNYSDLKFLVADDHSIVRTGIRLLLKSAYQNCTIMEAKNGKEVLEAVRKNTFNLITLDLSMPDTDATNLIKNILLHNPANKILLISMSPENFFALYYLKMGCYGYLNKDYPDDELLRAVNTIVFKNEKYLTRFLVNEITSAAISNDYSSNPFDSLSSRELQVIQHLIDGKSLSDIADLMCLHISTVSTHKSRAFEKLNITTGVELRELSVLNSGSKGAGAHHH